MSNVELQAITSCPFCAEPVKAEALVCPHCTGQLIAVPHQERGMVARGLKIGLTLFVVFFIAIPLLIFIGAGLSG